METYILFAILQFLFWPLALFGGIIYFFSRNRQRKSAGDPLQLALSREDAISQWYLFLSVCFLGVTLLVFNKDLGEPVSWRLILFITSSVALTVSYYFKTIYTLIGSLIGLTAWWGIQAVDWMDASKSQPVVLVGGFALIALLLYAIGRLHRQDPRYKRFSFVYEVLGIMLATGLLFFLSTKSGLGFLEQSSQNTGGIFASFQLGISLLALLLALIGSVFVNLEKRLMLPFEALGVGLLAVLFIVIVLVPGKGIFLPQDPYYYGSGELSSAGLTWAAILNVVAFFYLLGLIFSGYARREEWLINLGALFLFLLVVVKYFDWFFSFLDKSIFFIGAGILLFGVGWGMERGRKYMIHTIHTGDSSVSLP